MENELNEDKELQEIRNLTTVILSSIVGVAVVIWLVVMYLEGVI